MGSRVEELAVGGPARVVDGDRGRCRRVLAADAGPQDPRREPARGLRGVGRRRRDVLGDCGRRRRLGPVGDAEQLDVEDQHAGWAAGAVVVGELLGYPQAALLADHHQLDPLGPAGDDPVQGEGGRLAARDRGVEERPVGGPARVVDGDLVPGVGVGGAGARGEHLGAEAGGGAGRVGGRRGDVGGGGRLLRVGPRDAEHEAGGEDQHGFHGRHPSLIGRFPQGGRGAEGKRGRGEKGQRGGGLSFVPASRASGGVATPPMRRLDRDGGGSHLYV